MNKDEMLICPNCGHKHTWEERKLASYKPNRYHYVCPKCGEELYLDEDDKGICLKYLLVDGENTYKVKFYDSDKKLVVHADSFIKAGILAMAYIILKDGMGFGIEYVEDLSGMKVPVDIKD